MRKLITILFLFTAISVEFSQRGSAALVYRAGEGWSSESEEGEVVEATASAQLQKAQDLESKSDWKGALEAYRGLVRKYPSSGVAPKSQLKVAELYEKIGDYEHAFDAYGKFITAYPKAEEFDKAVEAQFDIAKRFLEGERRRLFGVKTFSSMEKAQNMFEAIVKNAPYSKYAPLSQYNIGQALEKQSKYPEAVAAYQEVTVKYPNDSVAVDAMYQIGYVYFKQSREAYDPAARTKARDAFEDFIARYPNSEKVPQAKEDIKTLTGKETNGVLAIAKYYDKSKNYKAAVIYYNQVIKLQPGTPDSDFAKNRIQELVSLVGEDALRAGPEHTETGEKARMNRKLAAQVDTAKRPDYAGPPVVVPVEVAPEKPKVRTSPNDTAPVPPAVEPALPQ